MGGQVSEVSARQRVLMEAATWVGPNIMRTCRPAHRGVGALREATTSDQAIAAQRPRRGSWSARGARFVPGTIDVTRTPPSRASYRCARSAWSACSGSRSRRAHVGSSSGSASSAREDRTGSLRPAEAGHALPWRGPALRRRRPARGRPDRGGRPHPRARQAPPTTPPRTGAVRRLSEGQRPAGLGTCCATAASTSASPTRSPRPPRSSACASATNRCCGSTTRCPRT